MNSEERKVNNCEIKTKRLVLSDSCEMKYDISPTIDRPYAFRVNGCNDIAGTIGRAVLRGDKPAIRLVKLMAKQIERLEKK